MASMFKMLSLHHDIKEGRVSYDKAVSPTYKQHPAEVKYFDAGV